MGLRAANLKCLRDPNFEKHGWHAGHISRIPDSSPKEDYENRLKRKNAGRKAYSVIRNMEHYYGMRLDQTQKFILRVFIKAELVTKLG